MEISPPPTRLVEASFADAVAAVMAAQTFDALRRRQLACSLRVIAEMIGRPPELIPARWGAVRQAIARLDPAQRGITAKTLANHAANVRAALSWMADERAVPVRGVPISPQWELLRERVPGFRTRINLSALMRYCSGQAIAPERVDDAVLDGYMDYRRESTALASGTIDRRRIVRAWNGCIGVVAGWPTRPLTLPPSRDSADGPAWGEFPDRLRAEVDAYLASLTRIRRGPSGRRRRPCKPSTIRVRRARLVAFARKAVALGTPLANLASLSDLLAPDLVERVLAAYAAKAGNAPNVYTIDLAALLASIASQMGCLEAEGIAQLDDMRCAREKDRPLGLTDKNLALIRRVLSPGVWKRVEALPEQLMREARTFRERASVKAAVRAQLAVAIGILTIAPVRLGNLRAIRLGENLDRPGGEKSGYWLVFPQHDVKNRVRLEFPLDDQLSSLIDEYLRHHRPLLMRGAREDFLFPGVAGGCKGPATLSSQISKTIAAATGLRVTVHQFRHAAAALILEARPGEYEFVRRVLGHKSKETTMNFYAGLETTQAARIFGTIVRQRLAADLFEHTPHE